MNIAENKLKTTVPAETIEGEGILLDMHPGSSQLIAPAIARLADISERLDGNTVEKSKWIVTLKSAFKYVRSRLIDKAFSGVNNSKDLMNNLKLSLGNNSAMPLEVFMPQTVGIYDDDNFKTITLLKIKRTLSNIKEIKKIDDDFALEELEERLEGIDRESKTGVLRQKVIAISRMSNFKSYLEKKENYIKTWTSNQEEKLLKTNEAPLSDEELSEFMKDLSAQKTKLMQMNILRYQEHDYFRRLNFSAHDVLCSNSLSFWKTKENLDLFHEFIEKLRSSFEPENAFEVFRFEKSFAYMLVGFEDSGVFNALSNLNEKSSVFVKIIVRQSDKIYRELRAENQVNTTLYYNCLKEAMYPYIVKLNSSLKLDLSDKFIQFFNA